MDVKEVRDAAVHCKEGDCDKCPFQNKQDSCKNLNQLIEQHYNDLIESIWDVSIDL